jgi:hypothetical protein
MDPKKSLEGFRVDTSQPKKKVKPIPKQTYKKGNAILIILFASLIGLTSGIGSAFAFGIKEMPPLDEPSAKSPVDQVEPSIKKQELKTHEFSPQKPPIDEPTVNTSPVDEPEKTEKAKDTPIIKQEKVEIKKSKKEQDTKEADKSENTTQNHSSVESKSKSEQKSTSASTIPTQQETSGISSTTKSASSEGESQQTAPKSVQTEKQTVLNKSVSGTQQEASSKQTQEGTKNHSTDQVSSSVETPDPKTKPGVLPDTAGNDLNHAVASFVIVCFSIAYLLAKKETHPQK